MAFPNNGVAVITGAGSGMGRCLAKQLAGLGMSLALSDVNDAGLAETVAQIGEAKAGDAKITLHRVDVSSEADVKRFAGEVEHLHGRATALFNNAGVALLGNFEEISLEDFRWLMDVNFWGVVYGTQHFLPLLKKEETSHLVNTSSLLGFVGAIGQSAYCASKFAVRGFTESLRHELIGTNVLVTCVHPGFVKTSIAENAKSGKHTGDALRKQSNARFEKIARTKAEDAAARIIAGVAQGKARILIGADAWFVDAMQRLRPTGYWPLLAKQFEDPSAAK
jgi:NAD(P)-dependent dehydrogenase (short-subunit alcohol dehydrogenase family)